MKRGAVKKPRQMVTKKVLKKATPKKVKVTDVGVPINAPPGPSSVIAGTE